MVPKKGSEVRSEILLFVLPAFGDFQGGLAEGTEQPGPDGALMVRRVPLGAVAPVEAPIGRIGGCEGPEAAGGEELLPHLPDDGRLLRGIEGREGESNGEELIRPDGGVEDAVAENVAQIVAFGDPEGLPNESCGSGQ